MNNSRPDTNDAHLDLFEHIMAGLDVPLRERWVRRFLPRTYAMLAINAALPHRGAGTSNGRRVGRLADE